MDPVTVAREMLPVLVVAVMALAHVLTWVRLGGLRRELDDANARIDAISKPRIEA